MTTSESLNDYLLRDDPLMMDAYKSIISNPYYLDKIETGAKPDVQIGYMNAGEVPEGSKLEVIVYDQTSKLVNSKTIILSSDVSIEVDGNELRAEQPPTIREGNTFAPMRTIFEAMGAQVMWDQTTMMATGENPVSSEICLQARYSRKVGSANRATKQRVSGFRNDATIRLRLRRWRWRIARKT